MRDVTRRALAAAYAAAEQAATTVEPHESGAWFEGDAEAMIPAALGLGLQALVGRWVVVAHAAGAGTKCVPVAVLNSIAEELIGAMAVAKHAKPDVEKKPDGKVNLGLSRVADEQRDLSRERLDRSRGGRREFLADKSSDIEYS